MAELVSVPKPMAFPEAHDTICSLLDPAPRGVVLDVPCGHCALAARLKNMGFSVQCCDIDSGLFELPDVELRTADLNKDPLPYEDGSFDCIVSANGLHRIAFWEHAVSEFSRCLRDGGTLLISLPHYSSLLRRILFLLFGSLSHGVDDPTFEQTIEAQSAHYRHALLYSQLEHALRRHGLTRITLHKGPTSIAGRLLFPAALGIKLLGVMVPGRLRARYASGQGNSMTALVGGRQIHISAKKRES